MVSIAQTSRKYRGRKAATYDAMREKQARWALENETVERMLGDLAGCSVLDCPVGTGRFLHLYGRAAAVFGIDASTEMLDLARRKIPRGMRVTLDEGDASEIGYPDETFDVTVCVRFLDLIDEDAMRRVVRELCRVTEQSIILTIRLGPRYVPKSNTATHDREKFRRIVFNRRWKIAESVPFRDAGWEIIRLERRR